GFVGGLVNGGTWESGLKGAFSAGLFFGAGELPGAPGSLTKVLGHALAGCISSAASGGKCGSGAIAGGFAEAVGPQIDVGKSVVLNIVKHAILGGIGSALGGGKFANGAVTGAF